MNGFLNIKKTGDTDRFNGHFFTACVSQVNVNTVKTISEQWSDLQVAKFPIVHALPSG